MFCGFFFNFYFYFILLYNTVLVLPYIDMNPPRVYTHVQQMFYKVAFTSIIENCLENVKSMLMNLREDIDDLYG